MLLELLNQLELPSAAQVAKESIMLVLDVLALNLKIFVATVFVLFVHGQLLDAREVMATVVALPRVYPHCAVELRLLRLHFTLGSALPNKGLVGIVVQQGGGFA